MAKSLTVKRAFTCTGKALELYEVQDGGHTWPSGFGYSTTVGLTAQDRVDHQALEAGVPRAAQLGGM